MASNFTVVLFQRQHLGDQPGAFSSVEPNVPFAGREKSFSFDCPDIDPGETAVLMFQSRDVDHQRNVFQLNGVDVFGGLPASPGGSGWNGNVMLIEPHHRLKATGNVLRVAARNRDGGTDGNVDDFIIDNVVITYKLAHVSWSLPTSTGDLAAFVKTELLPSITSVKGSGAAADMADRRDEYVLPTAAQLVSWRGVFQHLLAGSWVLAHVQARMISSTYNLVQFFDTPSGRTYYVLMEGRPGQIPAPAPHPSGTSLTDPADPTRRGWGTYVFDPQPQRPLSFSAPHPKDDLETADEAVEAYLALGARTLLIAGADRDQNTALATCAQSERPYFESDVAHTAETVFQMAFEQIYASDAITWHLQFHGNASCKEDLFLSNGIPAAPATLQLLAAKISAASAAAAAGGPVLEVGVYDGPGDCALRGTDNMQMRFASGVPHASVCAAASVPVGPSRFIHVEQRRDARRAQTDTAATPGRNRSVVVAGILAAFS
jgi:hypothetical protein